MTQTPRQPSPQPGAEDTTRKPRKETPEAEKIQFEGDRLIEDEDGSDSSPDHEPRRPI